MGEEAPEGGGGGPFADEVASEGEVDTGSEVESLREGVPGSAST